jgi:hypothetical protein
VLLLRNECITLTKKILWSSHISFKFLLHFTEIKFLDSDSMCLFLRRNKYKYEFPKLEFQVVETYVQKCWLAWRRQDDKYLTINKHHSNYNTFISRVMFFNYQTHTRIFHTHIIFLNKKDTVFVFPYIMLHKSQYKTHQFKVTNTMLFFTYFPPHVFYIFHNNTK